MKLIEALTWARNNCTPEAVARLRSRRVVRTLVDELFWRDQELNLYQGMAPDAYRVKVDAIIEKRRQGERKDNGY